MCSRTVRKRNLLFCHVASGFGGLNKLMSHDELERWFELKLIQCKQGWCEELHLRTVGASLALISSVAVTPEAGSAQRVLVLRPLLPKCCSFIVILIWVLMQSHSWRHYDPHNAPLLSVYSCFFVSPDCSTTAEREGEIFHR